MTTHHSTHHVRVRIIYNLLSSSPKCVGRENFVYDYETPTEAKERKAGSLFMFLPSKNGLQFACSRSQDFIRDKHSRDLIIFDVFVFDWIFSFIMFTEESPKHMGALPSSQLFTIRCQCQSVVIMDVLE